MNCELSAFVRLDERRWIAAAEHYEGIMQMGTMAPPMTDETQDLPASRGTATATAVGPGPAEEFAVDEVLGDAAAPRSDEEAGQDDDFADVANGSGSESGVVIATDAQLAAESAGEDAASDLAQTPGFEPNAAAEESATELPLLDAGEAAGLGRDGTQPEFGFLAALAPTLISAIGPSVAKAVVSRLSPRTRRAINRFAGPVGAAASAFGRGGTSGSVLGLVSSLLRKAEAAPAGESTAEVDEEFIEQTVAVLETIIGADDRVPITNTTAVPWRRICALKIEFGSKVYRGTGFFIGPRAIATAGHCVNMRELGWATKIQVSPGANGTARPFGETDAMSFRSVRGWVQDRKPEADIGCILLPGPMGRNVGSFGFAAFDNPTLLGKSAVLAGYPGDKPFADMWGMSGAIGAVGPTTLTYQTDTYGGQSGAGLYIQRNGQRYVVGIHNYGAGSGNSATRITRPVYDRLLAWSRM